MQVLSLHVGKAQTLLADGKWIQSGIFKQAHRGPLFLGHLGFEGDVQVHVDVHGGEGRAAYAYSQKAYSFWKNHVRPELLGPGAFGENVLLSELDENAMEVGDEFLLGEALVQATTPRFPCLLMSSRLDNARAQELMYDSGLSGVMFRVLRAGIVQVGDHLRLTAPSRSGLTIRQFLSMTRGRKISAADFEKLRTLKYVPQKTLAVYSKRILE